MNVYQKINEIRKKIEYLKKDALVQGYKAVTHDFVTASVRDYLIEFGVLVIPRQISGQSIDALTPKGNKKIRYEARYEIDFIDIDNPDDKVTMPIQAHADDTGDKAPGKALSIAVKYAYLKIFNIETGENDESRVEDIRAAQSITPEQVKTLRTMLEQYGKTEKEFIETVLNKQPMVSGIESLDDIKVGLYHWSYQFLEKRVKNGTAKH